jgi:enamine deaminase RidA (YjgF/YER057c/UK114 family)
MRNIKFIILIIFALFNVKHVSAQAAKRDIELQLKEMGIKLLAPSQSTGSLLTAVTVGNLVFLSGHGPDKPAGGQITGKVGKDLTVSEGKAAARLAGIAVLGALKKEIGDLNKVKRIIKVFGMVNAVEIFKQQPEVINGFTDLMVEVFGESGKHARSAIGVGSLPSNIAVEIEVIVELYP